MKQEDLKVRMKVVPISKSVGIPLNHLENWRSVKNTNKSYLIIADPED
jgi:hypothetical protein